MALTAITAIRLVQQPDGTWAGEVQTSVSPTDVADKKIFGERQRSLSIVVDGPSVDALLAVTKVTSTGDWPEDVLALPLEKVLPKP